MSDYMSWKAAPRTQPSALWLPPTLSTAVDRKSVFKSKLSQMSCVSALPSEADMKFALSYLIIKWQVIMNWPVYSEQSA